MFNTTPDITENTCPHCGSNSPDLGDFSNCDCRVWIHQQEDQYHVPIVS